jgi:hypothetical protein
VEAKPAREAGGRARGARRGVHARGGGTFPGLREPGLWKGGSVKTRDGAEDMAILQIRQFAERLGGRGSKGATFPGALVGGRTEQARSPGGPLERAPCMGVGG